MPTFKERCIGQTVICVASGPSLTDDDCALVQSSGYPVIAVNNTWQRVPLCDAIYASDYAWWKTYAKRITVPAQRWSNNKKAVLDYGCELFATSSGYNSGLTALLLALFLGAQNVVLLGYDVKPQGKRLHWHDPHTLGNNPTDFMFRRWRTEFKHATTHTHKWVTNCSRDTALKCFRRSTLADALTGTGTQTAHVPQI